MVVWQVSPMNLAIEYQTNKMITLNEPVGPHIEQDKEYVNTMKAQILHEERAIRPEQSVEEVLIESKRPVPLKNFEKEEIKQVDRVYTFGHAIRSPPFARDNFYELITTEHIAYRYIVQRYSGAGTYSQVVYSKDCRTGKDVAIKMMKNDASNMYAEIKMLLYIQKHNPESEFFVKLLNFGTFRGHVFLVLEPFETDLHRFIRDREQPFHLDEVTNMTRSLLRGLVFLAQHRIIHGDLKPSNVLLNTKDIEKLKIADFGFSVLSKYAERGHVVQSIAYRAPEIFCDGMVSCAIDMWSLGCIMMDLTKGDRIIPRPETDDAQFDVLLQMFGEPSAEFFFFCREKDRHFPKSATGKRVSRFSRGDHNDPAEIHRLSFTHFSNYVRSDFGILIWVMQEMFKWVPTQRISPVRALYHFALINEHFEFEY